MSVASVGYNPVSPTPMSNDLHMAVRHNDTAAYQEPKPQIIQSTASDLKRIGSIFNRKLQFEVDQNSRQVIVKVIDKETDKVIKELPPEELQRLHRNIKDTIGLLFNEIA